MVGVLFALTGDLDYLHGMLGCPNASLVSGPCVWCQCTGTGENTWCDFRQGGPWRMTRWSPQEWRLWENRNRLSLLTLPGASCWTIHYDWLHCKYLGMDEYIFGSVMAVLVNYVTPQSAEQNLQTAWAYLRQFFKDNQTPTPFRYMNRLSMFLRAAGKFPKLRGKGSEIRHFGKALLSLWSKEMNVHLSLHKKILLMLQLNVELEDTITEFKEEFSSPQASRKDLKRLALRCSCSWPKLQSITYRKTSNTLTLRASVIWYKNWPLCQNAFRLELCGCSPEKTKCKRCSP